MSLDTRVDHLSLTCEILMMLKVARNCRPCQYRQKNLGVRLQCQSHNLLFPLKGQRTSAGDQWEHSTWKPNGQCSWLLWDMLTDPFCKIKAGWDTWILQSICFSQGRYMAKRGTNIFSYIWNWNITLKVSREMWRKWKFRILPSNICAPSWSLLYIFPH